MHSCYHQDLVKSNHKIHNTCADPFCLSREDPALPLTFPARASAHTTCHRPVVCSLANASPAKNPAGPLTFPARASAHTTCRPPRSVFACERLPRKKAAALVPYKRNTTERACHTFFRYSNRNLLLTSPICSSLR